MAVIFRAFFPPHSGVYLIVVSTGFFYTLGEAEIAAMNRRPAQVKQCCC